MLLVNPYYKTISEVSTMAWISQITNIPIPRVLTYQSSRAKLIGFKWILINEISGTFLVDVWHFLLFSTKETLVKEFAVYSTKLFQNKLRHIGNIYKKPYTTDGSPLDKAIWSAESSIHSNTSALNKSKILSRPNVGKMVSMDFFWEPNINRDIYRGLFNSSKNWMLSRLLLEKRIY